jgi:murein L,D-transpeptidase YafK
VIVAFLLSVLLAGASALSPARAEASTFAASYGKADRVLVLKSERRLYLVRDHQVIATYAVALGRSPSGHKVFEGDGRTPEGLYVLDGRNSGSRFYRSIRISYPNIYDITEAGKYGRHPGGLVMIHGQPDYERMGHLDRRGWDWTEGCIAVSNAEMDEIWAATDEGTPIEILP